MSTNTRDTSWDIKTLRIEKAVVVDGVKTAITSIPGRMFHNAVTGGGAVTFKATFDPKALPVLAAIKAAGVEQIRFAQPLTEAMVRAIGASASTRAKLAMAMDGLDGDEIGLNLDLPTVERELVQTVPASGDRPEYTVAKVHCDTDIKADKAAAVMTFRVDDAIAALKAGAYITQLEAFVWAKAPEETPAAAQAPAEEL